MKKLLYVLFALILSLMLLVSCDSGTPSQTTSPSHPTGDPTDTAQTSEEPKESEPEKPLPVISEGGSVRYTLIRPDEITEEFFSIFNEFQMDLEFLTGGMVTAETDILFAGQTADPNSLEILFGNCNREETNTVKNSIGFGDWTVRVCGNKIVIFGHNRDSLKAAAEYCIEHLIAVDDAAGTVTLSGEYTHTSDEKFLFSVENPISGYTVVYPDGNALAKKLAERVATRINRQMGTAISFVSDAEGEQDCEILIGLTSRPESAEAFERLSPIKYCIRAVGKKLVIGAPSGFALENGIDAFLTEYFGVSEYTDALNFPEDCDIANVAYFKRGGAALYKGTDLRIMSWNMLTELWNDKIPVADRDEQAAVAILYYAPDVIGMQEITPAWYDTLENLLGDTYAFVSRKNQSGSISYNGIFYNKNKVKLIESGVKNYSVGAATMRLYTWALFERLSDGERFIVSSTHWDTGSYPDRIQVQANEMAAIVKQIQNKYQVPIFNTGDYNTKEDSSLFISFLAQSGFVDSRGVAEHIGDEGSTYHAPPLGEAPGSGGAIDHITVPKDLEIAYYTRLIDELILDASDHCPIYIDVKLGE